jgi:serine/threonine protein kinase
LGEFNHKNIFFIKRDNYIQVKTIVYGITERMQHISTTGFGMPDYSAPELLFEKDYDEIADSWGLGILLYLLICHSHPFSAKTIPEFLKKVVEIKFDFESHYLLKDPTFHLKDLVNKLLTLKNERLSIQEIKEHIWFCENREWSKENHFSFPLWFQKKIRNIFMCLKIFLKKFNLFIPKNIIFYIIKKISE